MKWIVRASNFLLVLGQGHLINWESLIGFDFSRSRRQTCAFNRNVKHKWFICKVFALIWVLYKTDSVGCRNFETSFDNVCVVRIGLFYDGVYLFACVDIVDEIEAKSRYRNRHALMPLWKISTVKCEGTHDSVGVRLPTTLPAPWCQEQGTTAHFIDHLKSHSRLGVLFPGPAPCTLWTRNPGQFSCTFSLSSSFWWSFNYT